MLDLNDARFCFSLTPSVAEYEADPAHRTTCPHPECLSRAENAGGHNWAMDTRVKVEGAEDYCIHTNCNWTEQQGEHFAMAEDVCSICGGLIADHGLHKARDCLADLTSAGYPTGHEAMEIVPYEVIE